MNFHELYVLKFFPLFCFSQNNVTQNKRFSIDEIRILWNLLFKNNLVCFNIELNGKLSWVKLLHCIM